MDDIQTTGMVEVRKTNTSGANTLLRAGWKLLAVVPEAEASAGYLGDIGVNRARHFWVQKWTAYILGRPAEVEPFEGDVPRTGRIRVHRQRVSDDAEGPAE